jgi:hypothetical protein
MRTNTSFSHRIALLLPAVFFVLLFSAQKLLADGKMFPQIAYKVPPTIPSQRAIIVYKDGIEKLIIESSLEGKGKEFGWIIPLPAEPNKFEKVSPGLLRTLSIAIQPKITHDLTEILLMTFWFTIFVFLIYRVHLLWIKQRIINIVLLLVITVIMFSLLMPTLSKTVSTISFQSSEGIFYKDIQKVGSYNLAVLDANSSDALDNWLRVNGFLGLQKEDATIVSNYIKEGWCFIAAKLTREADGGYSQPHPLSMSFVAQMPVYPMRLTSTIGSDVYLEIFVISDKQATNNQLNLEFSDEFKFEKEGYKLLTEDKYLPGFTSSKFNQRIGHPDSLNLLWDGCVLSKLCGTLKPIQMKKDIVFDFKEAGPYQKHYWTKQGALQGSAIILLIAFASVVIAMHSYYRINKQLKIRSPFVQAVVIALTVSIIAGGIIYAALPKIYNIKSHSYLSDVLFRVRVNRFKEHIWSKFSTENNNLENIKLEDFGRFIEEYENKNLYTGEAVKNEDSPGNYVFIEDERGIVWRTFSNEGFPEDFVLKPEAP